MTDRPSTGPPRLDVLVAVGCWLVVLATYVALPALSAGEPDAAAGLPRTAGPAWWAGVVVLTAQTLALVVRRVRPGAVLVVAGVAVPVGAAVGTGAANGLTSLAFVVAVYTLVTLRGPVASAPFLVVVGAVVLGGQALAGVWTGTTVAVALGQALLQTLVLVLATILVAALVLARRESRGAREDLVKARRGEQQALVQAAVARERTTMARELHDIAAHHLTGIAVMSAAIGTQLDTDPEAARAAVGQMRASSTALLRDLRGLVGLLRAQDAELPVEVPRAQTLAALPGLVEERVAGGADVRLTVLGAPDGTGLGTGVGPLAQLAAYRMVQESLANAARHAPGAGCDVEVDDRDPAALVVSVRNGPATLPAHPGPVGGRGTVGGLGLVGMRERAELTRSRLEAGPTPDGGWRVRLRTPRFDGGEPS